MALPTCDTRSRGGMVKRPPLASFIASALLMLLLAGCAGARQDGQGQAVGRADGEPRRGGILITGLRDAVPNAMDGMYGTGVDLSYPASSLYGDGNLVRTCRDDVYKLCPALAERWEANADFTEWTFKLRDGVVWHDGTPFTAEDVKFWLDLAFNGVEKGGKKRAPAQWRGNLGALKRVDAVQKDLVKVILGRPSTIFPVLLAEHGPHKIQHPRHLMQSKIDQGEVTASPVDLGLIGTGPFKIEKWEDSVVQVRRFDKYWGKDDTGRQLPFLDGIDYVVMKDPVTMDAAFRTGRMDVGIRGSGHGLTPEREQAYKQALGDRVSFAKIPTEVFAISYNSLKATPWADARVRRALNLWVDKQGAIKAMAQGEGELTTGVPERWRNPDWKTWPGFDQSPQARERDKAQAKRLLAEAGYPRGFPEFDIPCRKQWTLGCEFLQGQLATLGIEASIKFVDNAGYTRYIQQGDFNVHLTGVGQPFPELLVWSLTRASLSPGAVVKHEDKKVEEYFVRLDAASSFEDRVRLWREMERYVLLEQAYYLPLYIIVNKVPVRSYVQGWQVPEYGAHHNTDYATTWLDK